MVPQRGAFAVQQLVVGVGAVPSCLCRQGFYKEVVKRGVLSYSLPPNKRCRVWRCTGIRFERAASDLRRWRDRLEATDELRLDRLNRTPDYDSIGIY
jgi:hypothetical protein